MLVKLVMIIWNVNREFTDCKPFLVLLAGKRKGINAGVGTLLYNNTLFIYIEDPHRIQAYYPS